MIHKPIPLSQFISFQIAQEQILKMHHNGFQKLSSSGCSAIVWDYVHLVRSHLRCHLTAFEDFQGKGSKFCLVTFALHTMGDYNVSM